MDRPLLSRRELEVLALLDRGVKARAAAVELRLSEATVRSYIRSALRKLGCHSQLEAVAAARRLGLLGGGVNGHQGGQAPRRMRWTGYRLLAEILAGCLGGDGDGLRPEEAGEAWGRYLVDRPPLAPPLSPEEAARALTELLQAVGFQPQRTDENGAPRLILRACPFREVALTHRRVVCTVHRGVVRGALAELGGALTVHELRPLAGEDGACVLHLAVRATA